MQIELGYRTTYEHDYHKDSGRIGGVVRSNVKYIPFDGTIPPIELITEQESDFIAKAKIRSENKDMDVYNQRIIILHLRMGGELAHVIVPIEKQYYDAISLERTSAPYNEDDA